MARKWLTLVIMLGGTVAAAAGCGGAGAPLPPPPQEKAGLDAIQPDSTTTGAVSTVTPDSTGSPYADLIQELFQGRIPGLEVVTASDGTQHIRIRGMVQDMGNAASLEPLVVIDGMPSSLGALQALRGLHPQQIQKIQVLRDASSTAIYGTRGAGGVILVWLKGG